MSISLLTLCGTSSETQRLSEKIHSDLQHLGYQSQCWMDRSLYYQLWPTQEPLLEPNTQLLYFDAIVLVVDVIHSFTEPVLKHLNNLGIKKVFVIRRSTRFHGDNVDTCKEIFGSEKVVAIDFIHQLLTSISKR